MIDNPKVIEIIDTDEQFSERSWKKVDQKIEEKKKQLISNQFHQIDEEKIDFDLMSLFRKREFKKLIKQIKNHPQKFQIYPKLRYKQQLYQLGQNLCIESDQSYEYVAKLMKVYNLKLGQKNIPLIKVQWFYRKKDLFGLKNEQLQYVSNNELFLTNDKDYLEVETIISHAQVLTYQEYDNVLDIQFGTYYSRASFNPKNKSFTPPMNEWNRTCICQSISNPDLKYVQCDKCFKWCHLACVSMTAQQAKQIKKFICQKC